MAVDDEQSSSDGSIPANSHKGDNQNSMKNVEAGESITQRNEIHQHNNVSEGGAVIRDPNDQNGWVNCCESLSQLPYFESVVVPSFLGSGGLGFVGSTLWIMMQAPWNGLIGGVPSIQTPFLLIIASAALMGIPLAYLQTDKESQCPKCGERFALRTMEVRKTEETETDTGTVIHGERDIKCHNCGYSESVPVDWAPQEFDSLKGGSY